MNAQLARQIAQLHDLTMAELREQYQLLFGDRSRTMNRQFLFRRIAWRMQALAEGDLSDRARNRALLLAQDADLRTRPSREFHVSSQHSASARAASGSWRQSHASNQDS